MKKWVYIIISVLLFLALPSFTAKMRRIPVSGYSILLSRITLSITLILFGILSRIFATPLGNSSFKTTPKFIKKNSNIEQYINSYKDTGFNFIIIGILIVLIAVILHLFRI